MKQKKGTSLIWIIFVCLVGFIGYLKLDGEHDHSGHDEHDNVFESGTLLPVRLTDIYALEIGFEGNLYLIEKMTWASGSIMPMLPMKASSKSMST